MSDDIYRPRKKITPEDLDQAQHDPLENVQHVQNVVAQESGKDPNEVVANAPFAMKGNIPPQLLAMLEKKSQVEAEVPPVSQPVVPQPRQKPPQQQPSLDHQTRGGQMRTTGSDQFENLLQRLAGQHHWEEFELPSLAKFYTDIPKVIHVRPMTGEEEQILATPRFVKRGKAIDMIFQRCIREQFNTEDLLTIDRNHLLIYLRGISYTTQYDVEMKCPMCSTKFSTMIDLNALEVTECPNDFSGNTLEGSLPVSGFTYRYRLSTGKDEQDISMYRDKRIQQFGDQSEDDTLLYRTAILIEEIEGVTNKKEIQHLLKRLPISDVQYLRNEITEPPFGVDTQILINCPSCTEEFTTELPLEANFFFPRKKKVEIPA